MTRNCVKSVHKLVDGFSVYKTFKGDKNSLVQCTNTNIHTFIHAYIYTLIHIHMYIYIYIYIYIYW